MTTPSLLPRCTPAEAGLCPDRLARLSQVLRDETRRARLPGAVGMIVRDGRLAWSDTLGVLDPRSNAPMTEDAIFRIFSMTKPIVSVAVMMLLEEGRLMLSDPIAQHLPEFATQTAVITHDGRAQTVSPERPCTVQDLLRHTSGLAYEFTGTAAVHRMYAESGVASRRLTNAQACRMLANLPLLCRPGTRWEYSRSTDVLGRLIEVISGMTLGEFLATRVTGPLGMVDTAFQAPASEHHRVAEPFSTDPVTGEAVKLFDPRTAPTMESGGGGLVGTAADYVRFMQMMIGGGALDGTRLLGRKTVELMTSDHLGDIECDSPLLPPGHGFGLGFAVRLHAGISPMPGSVGLYYWGGIAGTTFWVDPAERLCAVLMLQAPGLRDYYRPLFRDMVYAALV